MRSVSRHLRRLEALERRLGPGEDRTLAADVAKRLGIGTADPLAQVVVELVVSTHIRLGLREAGEDPRADDEPRQCDLDAAIGVGAEATPDQIIRAASAGLKADPAGYRECVLAAHVKRQTGPEFRYDPIGRVWVVRDAWWVTPEQWASSLEPGEAARLAMAPTPRS